MDNSDETSLSILIESYHRTFDHIRSKKNFLSEPDKKHLDFIQSNADYSCGRPFAVLPPNETNPVYKFVAVAKELTEYAPIVPFLTAHEIHHALAQERYKAGDFNTCYIKNCSYDLIDHAAQKITHHAVACQSILEEKKRPYLKRASTELTSCKEWSGVLKVARGMLGAARIQEEFECDRFAIMLYPKTDLRLFYKVLKDYSIQPLEKTEDDLAPRDKDSVDTHPSDRSRLFQLRKQQRLLLA